VQNQDAALVGEFMILVHIMLAYCNMCRQDMAWCLEVVLTENGSGDLQRSRGSDSLIYISRKFCYKWTLSILLNKMLEIAYCYWASQCFCCMGLCVCPLSCDFMLGSNN
jgi:hypothetical protein